jgi:superfamily II DNA or RNA helicase
VHDKLHDMGDEELWPGAYESVVTHRVLKRLQGLPADATNSWPLNAAELPDRLALVVNDLVKRALEDLNEDQRVSAGPDIVRALTDLLIERSPAVDANDILFAPAAVLRSVGKLMPDGTWRHVDEPLTPLHDTALLTGARGEPTLLAQLRSEIPSSDSIDVLVAFIRQTGIRPLLGRLREHVSQGRPLRILTTTYTGSTEGRALDLLMELGAEIKVSYEEGSTRLHAKSWLFNRRSGLSTAYVGSSNLTHQAQVTGLEWNVRLSATRNPDSIQKLTAVFDSYWSGGDFVPYDPAEFQERTQTRRDPQGTRLLAFDITPHPFQRRMLEQLQLSRENGNHRNLVVAATGTGKTVLSAFDYKGLRETLPSSRLLFVAHRQEILQQSLDTFRHILRDSTFGELWVGGLRPVDFSHVFASIQSINTNGLEQLQEDHFDIVIVDEFHHAAADSYRKLLHKVNPDELLGLTATPERMDGQSILNWFDDRIAVELRLWDAIDQQRLVPFIYYGVDDGSDLRSVPRRGRDYDPEALGLRFTEDGKWIANVLHEVERLIPDLTRMKAFGFCASLSHAEFTARAFTEAGLPSAVLSGRVLPEDRRGVLADLRSGRLKAIFSVDVLSEGVDLPEVNTIFLMRPTQSATVFLQQIGRGLRRHLGKDSCLILDFIGAQADDFRFDLRYRALIGGGRADLAKSVEADFPYLPAGCQIQLDPMPATRVLDSLKRAIPSTERQQAEELKRLSIEREPTLGEFLQETGLDLDDVYRGDRSWMSLRERAGLPTPAGGPLEPQLRRAAARLLHIDDELRAHTYAHWAASAAPPSPKTEQEKRLLRMLVASLTRSVENAKQLDLMEAADVVWADMRSRADLQALMTQLERQLEHRGYPVIPLERGSDSPLQIHARYTRDEILCAIGNRPTSLQPQPWREGVHFEEAARADLFVFTLDKSSGSFSPSTRYRDYAINESLIHWESQSRTTATSATGQRYINHTSSGSSVLLFARPTVHDRAFWFLGSAVYVAHEGERPMAITWRLATPLPEDLYGAMAAAVA